MILYCQTLSFFHFCLTYLNLFYYIPNNRLFYLTLCKFTVKFRKNPVHLFLMSLYLPRFVIKLSFRDNDRRNISIQYYILFRFDGISKAISFSFVIRTRIIIFFYYILSIVLIEFFENNNIRLYFEVLVFGTFFFIYLNFNLSIFSFVI